MTQKQTAFIPTRDIAKKWWKSAVVYQVYPASFYDTNGDGVGDLKGVIAKLDYLKDLGVDAIWINPMFKSPQGDMGYDISDYQDIHEAYGTVADVDTLIAELHKRDMKLVLDLVPNHTSEEHPWFLESKSSKTNPKRNWYFWRPPKYDADGNRKEPNNWESVFGGPAWKWDESTQEYYLHIFDQCQPDLNWDEPEVREEMYSMMRWWIDKGADGYRIDVIGRISKNQELPDAPVTNPDKPYQEIRRADGPRLHEFLKEMDREVMSKYDKDIMSVGELNQVEPDHMLKFTHPDNHEISMGFTFDHCNIGIIGTGMWRHVVGPYKLSELKKTFSKWQGVRDMGAWHALYLENHDQPRSISRWTSDKPEFRWDSGRLLAMLECTQFGTVYIYQGQEIGMINIPDDWPLEEWKDVQTGNIVREFRERGEDVEQWTKKVYAKARDNARNPVQWNSEANGGFSTGTPWMRVSPDYLECNVEAQVNDPNSLFSFWKTLLALRKEHEDVLIYGSYRELTPEDERVFAYLREEKFLVVMNFTEETVEYELPEKYATSKLVVGTQDSFPATLGATVTLPAFAGVIYEVVQ